MGNVTFIIGNGFDLKMGLKTRYNDFYKVYTKPKADDSDTIKHFKKEILSTWEHWKDFELGMGQRSELFDSAEKFSECVDDFVVAFEAYLVSECKKINWSELTQSQREAFASSISSFYRYISTVSQNEIQKVTCSGVSGAYKMTAHFLQFNYTNAFDKLLENNAAFGINGLELGANVHVHGKMDGGYLTMGVNDESQIKKDIIKNHSDVRQVFIKQEFLNALQNRNVNEKIPRETALDAIRSSDAFCAFGTSIGDTDKYWWKKIGERLSSGSDTFFIIFDRCDGLQEDGSSPRAFNHNEKAIKNRKNEIVNRFVHLANLGPKWLADNPDRIIVELNSKMFDFKLPLTASKKSEVSLVLS